MKVRLLLADDHPLVRSGLIRLLESYKEFIVIGEARDGEEAVALAKKLKPDIVIIDLSMPKFPESKLQKLYARKFRRQKFLS